MFRSPKLGLGRALSGSCPVRRAIAELVAEQVLEASWPGGRHRVVEFGVDGPQPPGGLAIGEEAVRGDLPAGPPGVAARSAGCLLDLLHLRG